jgi:hypothetical protein
MQELLANPIVRGAVIGWWGVFVVDLGMWMKSTGWKVEGFSWAVASKRWLTGALSGALGAAGLGTIGV